MNTYKSDERKLFILVNKSKKLIAILAALIGIIFSWLKFEGIEIDIDPIVNQFSTELLIQFSIIVLYFSWIGGTTLDATDHGEVFFKVIGKGSLPKLGIFIAVVISLAFFTICFFWSSRFLSIALLAFWTLNCLFWILFSKIVIKPFFVINSDFYSNEGNDLIKKKFEIVENFMYNNWHIYRFSFGFLFLIPTVILSQSNYFDSLIKSIDKEFLVASLILIFVIVFEMWTWYFRLKRIFSLRLLSEIIDNMNV